MRIDKLDEEGSGGVAGTRKGREDWRLKLKDKRRMAVIDRFDLAT